MSKKSCILTKEDVPAYIREIVKRLYPILIEYSDEEGNWWGYTFRLNAKWKCGYESQLEKDCERLVNWCRSWHSYAKLIEYKWWQKEVSMSHKYGCLGDKSHRRNALREGFRNHAYLVISDSVAFRFEKDNFYREKIY